MLSLNAHLWFAAFALMGRFGAIYRAWRLIRRSPEAMAAFTTRASLRDSWRLAKQCPHRLFEFLLPLAGLCLLSLSVLFVQFAVLTDPMNPGASMSALSKAAFISMPIVAGLGLWLITGATERTAKLVVRHHGGICPRCMYDLRSLMDKDGKVATCPECGLDFHRLSVPSVWVGMYYVPRFRTNDPRPPGRPWLNFLFRDNADS